VEIERATSAELAASLNALIRLHSMRWREHGGGVLNEIRVQQFHALAVPQLDGAGMLDVFLCKIRDTIISVYYGLHDSWRAYAYLLGFDPAHAFISPGSLLIGNAIQQAADNGAREFHFLRGGQRYKYEWGATDRVSSRIVVCRTSQHGSP
jgi:CelD/BcsL family acetyltransferase involved in cellulose biosynthesis